MFFRRAFLLTLYKFSDIVMLFCSLALAIGIGDYPGRSSTLTNLLSARMTVGEFIVIIVATGTWHTIFRLLGLYETKRFGRRLEECIDILKSTSLGTCFISGIASLFYTGFFN
ncbi:MAG: hypothetical protein Q7J31_01925, partial [Syntrophales bacterium]|nr:hypothetical protein [Syntrophales bacterium]